MTDNVHKPAHYSGAGIECIDVIEATLGPYGFRMFCLGNVLKYSWRHRQKNGAEDLAKADVYRAWMLAGTAANRKTPPDIAKLLAEGIALADGFPVTGAPTHDLSPAMEAYADAVDAREVALPSDVGLNVDVEAAA